MSRSCQLKIESIQMSKKSVELILEMRNSQSYFKKSLVARSAKNVTCRHCSKPAYSHGQRW